MTIASLLDAMEVFTQELNTGSGERDEARAITALDMAQDLFEIVCASRPRLLGTTGTITTTANQETTTWPSTLMRLDSLWMLDSNSALWYEVHEVHQTGGHAAAFPWPLSIGMVQAAGRPSQFWINKDSFFWGPTPDAVYTLRWYGFKAQTTIAARSETFAYRDECRLAFANMACIILRTGVDNPLADLKAMAESIYSPLLALLQQPSRTRAKGRTYSGTHTT